MSAIFQKWNLAIVISVSHHKLLRTLIFSDLNYIKNILFKTHLFAIDGTIVTCQKRQGASTLSQFRYVDSSIERKFELRRPQSFRF